MGTRERMIEETMLIYRLGKCETFRAALGSPRDPMLQSSLSLPFDYYKLVINIQIFGQDIPRMGRRTGHHNKHKSTLTHL